MVEAHPARKMASARNRSRLRLLIIMADLLCRKISWKALWGYFIKQEESSTRIIRNHLKLSKHFDRYDSNIQRQTILDF